VLVATTVVIVGVGAMGRLFLVAERANRSARVAAASMWLAEEKMEQLRADATTLAPSPRDALSANHQGFFEALDANGRPTGSGGSTTAPPGASYVRRWSLEPLASSAPLSIDGARAILLQVLVVPRGERGWPDTGRGLATIPGATRLASVIRAKVQ
jgi:hypothetical protein